MAVLALGFALLVAPGLDAASLVWRSSEGCRIWMVVDGDTVKAWCRGEGFEEIRLLGFDTPELQGACLSETARAFAATYSLRWMLWTSAETATWTRGQRDRYGRLLARLRIDGQNVATTLIDQGLARAYGGGRRRGWCSREAA